MAILKDLMVYGGARVVGDSYLANVTATKFVKEGGTNKQFLMADGSVTTLTGDDEVDLTKYLPLTAGPGKSLTGDLYLTGGNVSPAIVFNRTNGWDYKIFNDDSAILRLQCNRGTDTWTDYSYFNGPNLAIGNNTLNNLQSSVGATTNSGNIYLWSTGNANGNGNRGLWVDAHGTGSGKSIITVDTNNNATLYGNLGWNYITSKPVMFTDFSSELPDDYNSGAGTKGWFRIMKGLNTMSHPIRFRIFSTYNSIQNSGFEFCLIPRYSGTFRLVQINGYTSSTNNDGGIPIGKIRIVRKSTNDSPRYFYIDFYYNATSKNTVHVLFDYYPYTSSSYVFQAPTRVNSLESGEVVNYTLLLDSGSHTNGNIQASKFIKILENNEQGEDVLLANGNTITQDQLRTQTNNPTGSDLSIWGVQYCDSQGIFKSVTDSLKMPSGKYIKASITDSSGTAILYYESGNILGAFGNGTTTNISTYIRSTGDNLYHRLGNSSNFNDYLIFDTNNYINYAVSLSGTQTITGLKTFNNEVKISSTLNFLSSSNYINIPSDSKLCFSAGGTTSGNWKFIIDPPSGPGSYYIFRPAVDLQGYLGNTNYKWGGVYASNFYGTASNVSTTADTSNTLYLVGVTSSATTTLKRDTSITIKGGIAAFPNNGGIQIKNYEGNYMSVITAATANYQRINIGDINYQLNLAGISNEVFINGNIAIHGGNYTTYLPFLNSTTIHATKTSKIYAPTSAGTANYILKSNGSGAPTWTEQSNLGVGGADKLKEVHKGSDGIDEGYPITFINNSSYTSIGENTYYDNYYNLSLTYNPVQSILNLEGGIIQGTQIQGNKVISKGVTVDELVNEFYNTEPEGYNTSYSLGFNNNFNYFAVASNQSLTTSYVTYNLISKSWTTQTDQTGWWHFYRDGNDVKLKIEFSNSNEIPVATSVEINWIQIYIYDGSQTYYLVNDSSTRSIDLSNVTSNYCILNVNNFDIKKHYTQNTTIQFVVKIRCKKTVLNEQLPDQPSFDGDNIVTLTKFGLTENNLYNVGFYMAKANWNSDFPELNKSYLCKDGLMMAKTTVSYGAIKLDTNNNLEYIKCNKSNAVVHGTFNIVAQ